MQPVLERMFKRASLTEQITALHTQITDSLDQAAKRAERQTLSLLDILCLPDANGVPNVDKNTLDQVNKLMAAPGPLPSNMRQFGVFNRMQCMVLDRSHRFVQCLQIEEYDITKTSYSPHELQEIGLMTCRSSAALAIKYAWLYYGQREGFVKSHRFYGNPACTSPVKAFFKRFFGMNNPSQVQTNEITFAIAQEIDMDPMDINSAMWIVDREWKKYNEEIE